MSRGRPPKITPAPALNYYGLERLGYASAIPLTGDYFADQLTIEFICFRISHRRSEGGLDRFGHMKKGIDLLYNNPDRPSMKSLVWNPWAERMMRKACECSELSVAGPTSAGKCWSPETPILRFDGTICRADEVRPGDLLMGDDSQPRTVQEVHSGTGPMYQVTPIQGEPWRCTPEHVLVLKRAFAPKKCWRRVGEITEVSAEDYFNASIQFKRQHKQFCVGVEFPEQPVPFDPRLLGIWLGDGHYHGCRISIPDIEPDVLAYVREWAGPAGYQVVVPKDWNPGCPSYPIYPVKQIEGFGRGRNPLAQFFKSNIRDGEKRIRPEYLINSRKVRLELLAGLLDTDGHAAGTYFEIATKYGGLKDDILFLARSLGFRVTATHRLATCQGKKFPSWRINIMGELSEIPTLRKKCRDKTLRVNSDQTGITVSKVEDGPWVGFSVDGNHRLLLGDFTVSHNSDPYAAYALFSYIADPTHTKVLIMSTTLDGAKLRIWKTFREYVSALPNLPGKPQWSTNRIQGPNYAGDGYGDSSGVMLLASEKSRERDALEKMLGIKAPMTGRPDKTFEALKARPEFADLAEQFDDEYLEDLLPRLANLTDDRAGKLILIVDEATGLSESLLQAINLNMKPGNAGNLQVIMIANPHLHWDAHGIFSEPKVGWENITIDDEEWETKTGGTCIRFNGEKNPRLTEKNERYVWMLSQQRIEDIARDSGGKGSIGYWRMVLGAWLPQGSDSGIYSQADIEQAGAMKKAVWGFRPPIIISALDTAYTSGGDKSSCSFFNFGLDTEGIQTLELIEQIAIKTDINDLSRPISYQMVHNWRKECKARGVLPEHACFDSTGGGISFADIVKTQWSSQVLGISAGGKAPKVAVGSEKDRDGKPVLASDRFFNRATQLWLGAMPFLRSGQIKGIPMALAKEIISRQYDKTGAADGRTLKIEGKRIFKSREKHSPDDSDSFFLGIELAKVRLGFKPSEQAAAPEMVTGRSGVGTWKAFCNKARRITTKRGLQ